jgi:hypothetical protein
LVEQGIENPRVGGSIPSSATMFKDLQKCRFFFVCDFPTMQHVDRAASILRGRGHTG